MDALTPSKSLQPEQLKIVISPLKLANCQALLRDHPDKQLHIPDPSILPWFLSTPFRGHSQKAQAWQMVSKDVKYSGTIKLQ